MTRRKVFNSQVALEILKEEIAQWLEPAVTRSQVVGSVRRESPTVHDIDLLIIPRKFSSCGDCEHSCPRFLMNRLANLAFNEFIHIVPCEDKNLIHFIHLSTGIPIDLHLVWSMEEWWTKLVALTGSSSFVRKIKIKIRELKKGNKKTVLDYHTDGSIEKSKGNFIWPRSERGVFCALGIPYIPPPERI